MIRVIFFGGILFALNASAADSTFVIEVANYEPASHSVRYELTSKNCKEPAAVGEPVAECNSNGSLDIIISASCNPGNGTFRNPGRSFSLANESLRAAFKKCGGGTVVVRADDVELPRVVGLSLSDIEKAFAAKENSNREESIPNKKVGEKIGNKGGGSQ